MSEYIFWDGKNTLYDKWNKDDMYKAGLTLHYF